MYLEVTGLSQQQQTEGVIELGVGEQHGLQRRVPDPAWVQGREGLDLSANVGGSVEQEPSPVVGSHRDRRLGARTAGPRAVAHSPTLRATAVPLREPSSRCRSEHTHPHTRSPSIYLWGSCGRRTIQPGALSAYSDSGQIPAYAVTSALVPISSNSAVSHSMVITSKAITSFHIDFIVQAHRVLTDPARSVSSIVPGKSGNHAWLRGHSAPNRRRSFSYAGWRTPPSVRDICAYSSGSAKQKRAFPRGIPAIAGPNPSTQLPQPTGTAMYCLPSML